MTSACMGCASTINLDYLWASVWWLNGGFWADFWIVLTASLSLGDVYGLLNFSLAPTTFFSSSSFISPRFSCLIILIYKAILQFVFSLNLVLVFLITICFFNFSLFQFFYLSYLIFIILIAIYFIWGNFRSWIHFMISSSWICFISNLIFIFLLLCFCFVNIFILFLKKIHSLNIG